MTAMISAELLRLRTVATHRWIALGLLALIAVNAAPFVNGASTTADEVVAQLRGLAQLAMVMVAAYAAHIVGDEFRRGSVAMTYLVHPSRGRVDTAPEVTSAPRLSRSRRDGRGLRRVRGRAREARSGA